MIPLFQRAAGGSWLLDVTYNNWLVLASIAVALMAGFTGLSLTRGASEAPAGRRKLIIVIAAVALGGGIWSMHFVAMLGLQLPVLFYYDALITLISALVAILVVGLALLILHFLPRTSRSILAAGTIVGLGISLMHFIGMTGMQICRPVNSLGDYVLSGIAAIALSNFAIWMAYDSRTTRNILLGTVCFALAVVTVHFLAIAQTGFVLSAASDATGSALSNQSLAMGVTVAVFMICGAFLLTGVTFLEPGVPAVDPQAETTRRPATGSLSEASGAAAPTPEPATAAGVPYQREGQTHFAPRHAIAAVRAEGHYTVLYLGSEKLFCPWTITEAETRLGAAGFVRTHRSYLINPKHVSSFERLKDTGAVYFDGVDLLNKVPVSRSRLTSVREVLGL